MPDRIYPPLKDAKARAPASDDEQKLQEQLKGLTSRMIASLAIAEKDIKALEELHRTSGKPVTEAEACKLRNFALEAGHHRNRLRPQTQTPSEASSLPGSESISGASYDATNPPTGEKDRDTLESDISAGLEYLKTTDVKCRSILWTLAQ
jgi:hypothetical protein